MHALPHLQSCVIVLLKVILLNLTALLANPTQANGVNGNAFPENGDGPHKDDGRAHEGGTDDENAHDKPVLTLEQLEAERAREIEFKAVSGVLLLLLKWFKLSRELRWKRISITATDGGRHVEIRIPGAARA